MARRIDENQREIVKALRSIGVSVQILSDMGKGCPDILCGHCGINYLFEIKNGALSPSRQKLTPHEQTFFDNWRGQVCIITSITEAIGFFNGR